MIIYVYVVMALLYTRRNQLNKDIRSKPIPIPWCNMIHNQFIYFKGSQTAVTYAYMKIARHALIETGLCALMR